MHRFYCASLAPQLLTISIDDPQEAHHIARVLRLEAGDDIELINGRGDLALARLTVVSKTKVEVQLVGEVRSLPADPFRFVLACALPKRSNFDDIVEKCTELGVSEIVPLITDRTEVAPSLEARERMGERFNKIVLSSSKQCKRLWFPIIHPPMTLEAAVDLYSKNGNHLFIPWLQGERRPISDIAYTPGAPIVFFIGPEGDFTQAEAAYAIARGATPVSLGDTVLRVETAAIAVVSYARFIATKP